jgi:hypothetical protein
MGTGPVMLIYLNPLTSPTKKINGVLLSESKPINNNLYMEGEMGISLWTVASRNNFHHGGKFKSTVE